MGQNHDSQNWDAILDIESPSHIATGSFKGQGQGPSYASHFRFLTSALYSPSGSDESHQIDSGIGESSISSLSPMSSISSFTAERQSDRYTPIHRTFFDDQSTDDDEDTFTPMLDFGVHQSLYTEIATPLSMSYQPTAADMSPLSPFGSVLDLDDHMVNDSVTTTYPIVKRIKRYVIPKRRQLFINLPSIQMTNPIIPASIQRFYHQIRATYSDYAFSYALSAQLCADILPMDVYVSLKQCLLLSIIAVQVI